jgi:hypothetical protein
MEPKFNKLVERRGVLARSRSALMLCTERFVSSILKVWRRRCQTDKTEVLKLLSPNKNYVVNLSKLLLVSSK